MATAKVARRKLSALCDVTFNIIENNLLHNDLFISSAHFLHFIDPNVLDIFERAGGIIQPIVVDEEKLKEYVE